jgi:hypothetical protein
MSSWEPRGRHRSGGKWKQEMHWSRRIYPSWFGAGGQADAPAAFTHAMDALRCAAALPGLPRSLVEGRTAGLSEPRAGENVLYL